MARRSYDVQSYLDDVDRRSRLVEGWIRELAGELTGVQLNWRPAPDRWSVGQCVDHVLTANRLYLERIERVSATAPAADPGEPFRSGPIGSRFAASLGPDAKRKLPAPRTFAPSSSEISLSVLDEFADQQAELRSMYGRVRAYDLTRTMVPTPVSRLIRFRLGDILMVLANHQERHVRQAERVMSHDGFPASRRPRRIDE